jgi:hypothetical protein
MTSTSGPTGIITAELSMSRRNLLKCGAVGLSVVALPTLGARPARAQSTEQPTEMENLVITKERFFTSPDKDVTISVYEFQDPSLSVDALESDLRAMGDLTPEMEALLLDFRTIPQIALAGGEGLLGESGSPRITFSAFEAGDFNVSMPDGRIVGFNDREVFVLKPDDNNNNDNNSDNDKREAAVPLERSEEAANLWVNSGGQEALLEFAPGLIRALSNARAAGFDVFPEREPDCLAMAGLSVVRIAACFARYAVRIAASLPVALTICLALTRILPTIFGIRRRAQALCRRRFPIDRSGAFVELLL